MADLLWSLSWYPLKDLFSGYNRPSYKSFQGPYTFDMTHLLASFSLWQSVTALPTGVPVPQVFYAFHNAINRVHKKFLVLAQLCFCA